MARPRGCTCYGKRNADPCEACWLQIERAELERDDPPDESDLEQSRFERWLDRRWEG